MNAEESPADAPPPSLAEAWSYGGWEGVLDAIERRMRTRAGAPYAAAMIVLLARGLSASVVLLWVCAPDE